MAGKCRKSFLFSHSATHPHRIKIDDTHLNDRYFSFSIWFSCVCSHKFRLRSFCPCCSAEKELSLFFFFSFFAPLSSFGARELHAFLEFEYEIVVFFFLFFYGKILQEVIFLRMLLSPSAKKKTYSIKILPSFYYMYRDSDLAMMPHKTVLYATVRG